MSNDRDGELPSWPEVRMLLESPSVDSETKRALALRYFDNIEDQDDVALYGFDSEARFDELASKYREELSISGWDTATESSFDGDVYDSYKAARDEFDKARTQDAQDQAKAIQQDRESLGELENSASKTDTGVKNSDEILDLGNSCIEAIGNLVGPYNRARTVAAPQLPGYDLQDDVIRRYDEQRDVRFDKFGKFAADLTAVADAMSDAWIAQDNRMATVFGDWAGQGRESAQSAWAGMRHGEDVVEQALRDNATAVDRAAANVADSCRNKVGWLQKYEISGGFQGVEWYEVNRLCNIAELGRNASDNDFKHFIQYMPADLQAQMRDDCGDLEGELKDRAQEWAKQWLQQFCEWFSGYIGDFRKTCDNVRTAVDGAWDALNEQLADSPTGAFNEQGGPPSPGPSPAPSVQPAGQSGAGGSASVPAVSPPPMGGEPPAGPPAGPGSAARPATPVTGEPLKTDPETGEPYPIDPETGQPITRIGDEPDSLTVTQGDRRISMVEPDDRGEMAISIDDGTGQPVRFTLDFTEGDFDPGGAVEGQNQPDAAGSVHRPGDDGTVRIEADGLSVTAERPAGEAGPTLVTVEDGSGAPITYSLGADAGPGSFDVPDRVDDTAFDDTAAAADEQTSAQGFSGALGDLGDPADPDAGVAAGLSPGDEATLGVRSDAAAPEQGSAGLGTAPGGGGAHAATGGGGSAGSSTGGMGMMGAGMAGAGGQGGEDQQRSSSGFLVDDTIFDIGETAVRISGNLEDVLGDEVDVK